jgi:hypothetical protein
VPCYWLQAMVVLHCSGSFLCSMCTACVAGRRVVTRAWTWPHPLTFAPEEINYHVQEVKELRDAAKRAGKKAKEDFKAKEADMAQRHDRDLQVLLRSASECPSEQPSEGTAPSESAHEVAGAKVSRLHLTGRAEHNILRRALSSTPGLCRCC